MILASKAQRKKNLNFIADAMSWFQFTVAVVAASSDSNDMIR